MASDLPDIDEQLATDVVLNLVEHEKILRAIVEHDPRRIFSKGKVLPPDKWPDDLLYAIKGFKLSGGVVVAVDWHDRLKAATDLAKIQELKDQDDGSLLDDVPREDLKEIADELGKIIAGAA